MSRHLITLILTFTKIRIASVKTYCTLVPLSVQHWLQKLIFILHFILLHDLMLNHFLLLLL